MNGRLALGKCASTFAVSLTAVLVLCVPSATAQNAGLQAKLAEVQAASAANKVALSHYNWQESVTTSIKGEVKKQRSSW